MATHETTKPGTRSEKYDFDKAISRGRELLDTYGFIPQSLVELEDATYIEDEHRGPLGAAQFFQMIRDRQQSLYLKSHNGHVPQEIRMQQAKDRGAAAVVDVANRCFDYYENARLRRTLLLELADAVTDLPDDTFTLLEVGVDSGYPGLAEFMRYDKLVNLLASGKPPEDLAGDPWNSGYRTRKAAEVIEEQAAFVETHSAGNVRNQILLAAEAEKNRDIYWQSCVAQSGVDPLASLDGEV